VIRFLVVAVAALVLAPAALACNSHPTLSSMESQIMCPVCGTTLDQSDSPAALQIERFIKRRIAAGDTEKEIKDALVANYGEAILASPPRRGFGLLAWWVPLGGIVVAAALVGWGVWRWSRAREPEPAAATGGVTLDPALERRLDDELKRFET
jgi:cytochrome c-type biogenesis protein CcmH/NrfF